jgi:hypothetical protein
MTFVCIHLNSNRNRPLDRQLQTCIFGAYTGHFGISPFFPIQLLKLEVKQQNPSLENFLVTFEAFNNRSVFNIEIALCRRLESACWQLLIIQGNRIKNVAL